MEAELFWSEDELGFLEVAVCEWLKRRLFWTIGVDVVRLMDQDPKAFMDSSRAALGLRTLQKVLDKRNEY